MILICFQISFVSPNFIPIKHSGAAVRKPYSTIIYALIIVVGLMAMYTILNAGNPKSFWRLYFPESTSDIYLAMGLSVAVFILGFVVFYTRDREGFRHLIEMNADRIRGQRKKGKSDADIAESILSAMGSSSGYRHNMAKRKLIAYLTDFK